MRLRLVRLIVDPAQALCDSKTSPFLLMQNAQLSSAGVEVIFGYNFQHVLWQYDVTVLVEVIVVPLAIVNVILKLFEPCTLRYSQQSRLSRRFLGHRLMRGLGDRGSICQFFP